MTAQQCNTLKFKYLEEVQKYRDFLSSLKLSTYEEKTLLSLIHTIDMKIEVLSKLNVK